MIRCPLTSTLFPYTTLFKSNVGGQRQIHIAWPKRNHEHLGDARDHRKDGDRKGRRDHPTRAVAMSESDGRYPDQERTHVGPDPWFGKNVQPPAKLHRVLLSVRLIIARAASTMIRIPPCAPTCQSGEILMKLSRDPASVSVKAPITAPIGETRPPTNSPP